MVDLEGTASKIVIYAISQAAAQANFNPVWSPDSNEIVFSRGDEADDKRHEPQDTMRLLRRNSATRIVASEGITASGRY
jgi:hypothetical protein